MVGLANCLGSPLPYETTQDIQNEIRKVVPGFYNLGQVAPLKPTLSPDHFGSEFSKAVGDRYKTEEPKTSPRPFGLRLVQRLYHSGKLSTRASGLMEISPNTKSLSLGPEDMKSLGLVSGNRVRVTSDRGTLEIQVEEDISLLPGSCTFPEHFNDPPVKDLMSLTIDHTTGVPYFKLGYVTLEKAV